MRGFVVFRKTLREMARDPWVLGLTLAFAPFFVVLYWLWFFGGSTTYTILLLDHDQGATLPSGGSFTAGKDLIEAIQGVTYADGKSLLKVRPVTTRSEVENLLRERRGVAFVEIPAGFSSTLLALQAGDRSVTAALTFGGDLTNPYYTLGGMLAISAVEGYVQQITGQQPIIQYVEQPLGGSAARSEFETYVPGVLVLAVILLIFQAAMTVAREIESGALRRLQLTPMTASDLLGGITAALALVGAASVALTFFTAVALGFRSLGPLWVAILVGVMTSLSVIGIGLVVACFSRTVSQAFVVANFPLALMMFFSGSIFPVPQVALFAIGDRTFGLYDLLPATHAVLALNKILTLGAGLAEVTYELGMLSVLSIVYFAIGVVLFRKMHRL